MKVIKKHEQNVHVRLAHYVLHLGKEQRDERRGQSGFKGVGKLEEGVADKIDCNVQGWISVAIPILSQYHRKEWMEKSLYPPSCSQWSHQLKITLLHYDC